MESFNIRNMSVNLKDAAGKTPLHWALRLNNENIAYKLLACEDIDVYVEDRHGFSPLSLANSNNSLLSSDLIRAIKCRAGLNNAKLAEAEKKQKIDGAHPRIYQIPPGNLARGSETFFYSSNSIGWDLVNPGTFSSQVESDNIACQSFRNVMGYRVNEEENMREVSCVESQRILNKSEEPEF